MGFHNGKSPVSDTDCEKVYVGWMAPKLVAKQSSMTAEVHLKSVYGVI
ncbi:hypothetical protein GCM10023155_09150 [Bremerella cremea]